MLACLDLEGVLLPEIWIAVSEKTGIEKLRLTTRDISDYDELMGLRLKVLDEHKLKIQDIQAVINTLYPLEGAKTFLDWLKSEYQVIILSDTFSQFAKPLMAKLDFPALFCHDLEIADDGTITNYRLRLKDQKRKAIEAFHQLKLKCVAAGDSYNDTSMLKQADRGILFCPPDSVVKEFPQFEVTRTYTELKAAFQKALQDEKTGVL
jgi:phosphoserine/homoserine phosphotransferase